MVGEFGAIDKQLLQIRRALLDHPWSASPLYASALKMRKLRKRVLRPKVDELNEQITRCESVPIRDLLFRRRTSSSVLPLTVLATDVYQSLVHRTELPQHREFHLMWYDYRLTLVHPSRIHGRAYWDAFYVDTPGKLPESPGDIIEVVSTHSRKPPPASRTCHRGADVATLHCLKASCTTVCNR